jgi:hypothetical protein
LQINIESGALDIDDEIDQLSSSLGRLKQVGRPAIDKGASTRIEGGVAAAEPPRIAAPPFP